MTEPRSDLAIPPGEYLAEVLAGHECPWVEFAKSAGWQYAQLLDVILGTGHITHGMADDLERVLDVPAHVWLGLEREYRATLARGKGASK